MKGLKIFTANANPNLAKKVAEAAGGWVRPLRCSTLPTWACGQAPGQVDVAGLDVPDLSRRAVPPIPSRWSRAACSLAAPPAARLRPASRLFSFRACRLPAWCCCRQASCCSRASPRQCSGFGSAIAVFGAAGPAGYIVAVSDALPEQTGSALDAGEHADASVLHSWFRRRSAGYSIFGRAPLRTAGIRTATAGHCR